MPQVNCDIDNDFGNFVALKYMCPLPSIVGSSYTNNTLIKQAKKVLFKVVSFTKHASF